MIKINLCGLTYEEILNLSDNDSDHALSIAKSIYKKGINDISQFTGVPKRVKEKLIQISTPGIYQPVSSEISEDGTVKYLFRNIEGLDFETVYLPDIKRHTVCVSSQSGCRMGCPFCVSGKYGFRGNLSAGDMLIQILGLPVFRSVTHVVFMGMGEPMDNLDNVIKACNILSAPWGLALSPAKITVSTVGITDAVTRFLQYSKCNLALSLYSPFPEERFMIIPAEKKYPAHSIIEKMKNFPLAKRRRMSVAYIMIKDLNDTQKHLDGLKSLLRGSQIRINLVPYHSIPWDKNISSSPERIQFFKHKLITSGISASIRKSRGIDISAACGLLASSLR